MCGARSADDSCEAARRSATPEPGLRPVPMLGSSSASAVAEVASRCAARGLDRLSGAESAALSALTGERRAAETPLALSADSFETWCERRTRDEGVLVCLDSRHRGCAARSDGVVGWLSVSLVAV